MGLENVSRILLILSGKGGVGKSSVTLQLALALTQQGHNVGILDIDLTGPSIPRLLGLEDQKVKQAPGGWLPVKVHDAQPSQPHETDPAAPTASKHRGSLHAISLAFLLPSRSSAVIWRGPKKTAMIRQFVSDVLWPPGTDYLLIDTPPGTSDEHIAIVEELHRLAPPPPSPSRNIPSVPSNGHAPHAGVGPRLSGAVVVTTPQAISVADVRKELNFCLKTAVPVLGVVENMSGFMCPCCGEVSNVFSKGGGEVMARECGVPFLGSVPIDTTFGELVEGGGVVVDGDDDGGGADDDDGGVAARGRGGGGKEALVERYRRCGLCGIFQGFARGIAEETR